jgi:guanyl-specific ribonuclease Sa
MKPRIISLVASVTLIAGLAVPPAAFASDSSDVTKALAGSSAQELPAKAANLVTKASATDKEDVAVAVVKAAVGLNPAAAVAVVSAVVRGNPSAAPVAAVTAAKLQHKQIGLVAKAAVAAAPSEAGKIVAALIKEFPKDYSVIAIAGAEGAPLAGREILSSVADNVPALQPAIQGAIAMFAADDSNIPVLAIMSQINLNNQAPATAVPVSLTPTMITVGGTPGGSSSLAGPTFLPPFTPVTTVNNFGTGQTVSQSVGGRNYATP